jgi:L-lactate dehydrogenase complex protein LldG
MTNAQMTNHQSNPGPALATARDAILARVEAAIGPVTTDPSSDWAKLPRTYIHTDSLTGSAVIDLFEHRILDYGAHVFRCTADQIQATIAKILAVRGAKQLLLPEGFPVEWLTTTHAFTTDTNLSYDTLNKFDGVLTTATAAIAATGSIVLQHGAGQGRRALTLIPDYHLCIVRTDQVVETVPAAFARLDPVKPTTFISGPSATADIEMTRIKGVHGPRFMDVVLVS